MSFQFLTIISKTWKRNNRKRGEIVSQEEKGFAVVRFNNGFKLYTGTRENIVKRVFKAIKEGLPSEALTPEIIGYLLRECIKEIQSIEVKL